MSAEETVREMFAAVEARDLGRMLAYCAPDVELVSVMTPAEGGDPYLGHAGIERWWTNTFSTWDEYRLDPQRLLDLDGHLFGVFALGGRGKTSGLSFERPIFVAFEFRGGQVAWIYGEFELAAGLRALAARVDAGG